MLQLNNIVLKYSYKTVLAGVNLLFEDGKIYSLLGENGAGKSTLAGIICGDRPADSGSIFVNSQKRKFNSPKDAILNGIMCVHQRPLLCDDISIKENFLLGSKKLDEAKAAELLSMFLPERKLSALVRELSLGERFFVSLIGILLKNPSFLILDEPSALLDEKGIESLFNYLHSKTKEGLTVLLITHFIKEALNESDYLILLKNGVVEQVVQADSITEEEIVKVLYKGIDAEDFNHSEEYKTFITQPGVKSIKTRSIPEFIKYETELSVRVTAEGKRCGIIPSERTFTGSNPNLTVFQICTALKTGMKQKELNAFCGELLQKADINIKPEEKAANLSGGMLQRIILERELAENPDVMVLCEPFQGLDFLACKNLYLKLQAFVNSGKEIVILEAEK